MRQSHHAAQRRPPTALITTVGDELIVIAARPLAVIRNTRIARRPRELALRNTRAAASLRESMAQHERWPILPYRRKTVALFRDPLAARRRIGIRSQHQRRVFAHPSRRRLQTSTRDSAFIARDNSGICRSDRVAASTIAVARCHPLPPLAVMLRLSVSLQPSSPPEPLPEPSRAVLR